MNVERVALDLPEQSKRNLLVEDKTYCTFENNRYNNKGSRQVIMEILEQIKKLP